MNIRKIKSNKTNKKRSSRREKEKEEKIQKQIEEEHILQEKYKEIIDSDKIPEYIIQLFPDKKDLVQFISNIEQINPDKLDPEELLCGRYRAASTISDAFE